LTIWEFTLKKLDCFKTSWCSKAIILWTHFVVRRGGRWSASTRIQCM